MILKWYYYIRPRCKSVKDPLINFLEENETVLKTHKDWKAIAKNLIY